ncbi:hypothetical protein N7E70_021190 [Aminobacter sp. NyZ550]|jgi:hypothetical protein|uniref:hypothetical protein n=1 Tax=Aminobacter sp. NyZ550 TaxID=2979870 RepID=UPI0021D60808|nr:hypothetical protein [Aminobacter sp. NyZ550]WAX94169.1 hypothetical protein N7E70_021190 [Aminobacter sp. NyZ550]
MPHEKAIAARKPAPNYRDPNDSSKPNDRQNDDGVSQKAAENRKPADTYGNTEPVDETNEKTRHADGQNPPGTERPNPDQPNRNKPNPDQPDIEKPGGSEQAGYRMKRARFWQS